MQQILDFLIRKRNPLLFLLLMIISYALTVQSHSYHRSKFINSTGAITGGLFKYQTDISNYFKLKSYNQRLLEENALLKTRISNFQTDSITSDKILNFKYYPASVINNTYHKTNNYLTIDAGINDSIHADMGVITDKGIVGVVEKTSSNYATVISILNHRSSINAQLKKTNHFGSLKWDGKYPNIMQLHDVPRFAPIAINDTIITGGRSTIFPKGIPIGSITNYTLDDNANFFDIDITLFNDMTDIGFVQIIENQNANEIQELEKEHSNEK